MKLIARAMGILFIGAAVFGSSVPAAAAVVNERSVTAGINPNRIATTPDGAQTWTLATTTNELIGYTTGANLDLVASWPLPGTDYVYSNVAILPDGTRAIVTDTSNDRVNVVDLATGSVTNPPTLDGIAPKQLALSPDGSKVAVAYGGLDPIVSVFNTSDWSFVAGWGFGQALTGLAFSPDSRQFAAVATAIDTVYLMDLSIISDFVVAINTADMPESVAYSADGASVYVASFVASSIQMFDALSRIELLSISTERTSFMAVSPDGSQLWASQPVGGRVGVFDATDLSLIEAIPFAGNASGIAFAQNGCQVWVTKQFGGSDTVFDLDPCLSPPATDPELPDTGSTHTALPVFSTLTATLIGAGCLALVSARRAKANERRHGF
jgi:DNA-binding beta-propeller fold protein YncE